MDPFQPQDVANLVVRFLAAHGWEETVMSMIREIPSMKYNVPKRPPNVSTAAYLKLIARPTPIPTLSDLLNDYGKSKIIVPQMIQRQNPGGSPLRQQDALVTQLKQLGDIISRPVAQGPAPQVVKIDFGVNTERKGSRVVATQTEDEEFIEEEEQDPVVAEVPLMFYNSLMSDPQKLASVINEHLTDSVSSKDDALQKVGESEIDKFMFDLLRDDDSCSLSTMLQRNDDLGLSNLLNDDVAPSPPKNCATNNTQEPMNSNSLSTTKNLNKESSTTPSTTLVTPRRTQPPNLNSITKSTTNSNHSATPVPMKRIVPKPAPLGTPRPNPVFQLGESPIAEKVVHPITGRPYTVVCNFPKVSDWERLGRRSIIPRVETLPPPPPALITEPISPAKSPSKSAYQTPIDKPSTASSNDERGDNNAQITVNNSGAEVTPILADLCTTTPAAPSSTSDTTSKKRSPRFLGLVSSAQKILATTTHSSLYRKSFSTPRKKHVRSLFFNTPPPSTKDDHQTLHANPLPIPHNVATPDSTSVNRTQNNVHGVSHSLPLKRKSTGTSPHGQSFKKRLQWNEEDLYKSSAFPDRNFGSMQLSKNMMESAKKIVSPEHLNVSKQSVSRGVDPSLFDISEERSESSFESSREILSNEVEDNPPPEPPESGLKVHSISGNDMTMLDSERSLEEGECNDDDDECQVTAIPSQAGTTALITPPVPVSSPPQEFQILENPPTPAVEVEVSTTKEPATLLETLTSPLKISKSKKVAKQSTSSILDKKDDKQKQSKNKKAKVQGKKKMNNSSNYNRELVSQLFGSEQSSSSSPEEEVRRNVKRKQGSVARKKSIAGNIGSPTRSKVLSPVCRRSPRVSQKEKQQTTVKPSPMKSRKSQEVTPKALVALKPTRKSKSPSNPVACTRKSRAVDVIAAKTVADSAVPLGRPSLSPKKKKDLPRKSHSSCASQTERIKSPPTLPPSTIATAKETTLTNSNLEPVDMSLPTASSSNSPSKIANQGLDGGMRLTSDVMTIHTMNIVQATPVKDPSLHPFQIMPAPIGFPDPTPVKNSLDPTDLDSRSQFSALITPLKTVGQAQITSPFLGLPPTPRYIPHDIETNSNSNSNFGIFRSTSDHHNTLFRCGDDGSNSGLNTPFKLGPPPTPGKSIFFDERSQGAIMLRAITTTTTLNQDSSGGSGDVLKPTGRGAVEATLDLSPPIPPHRMAAKVLLSMSTTTVIKPKEVAQVPSHVSINRRSPMVIVGNPTMGTLSCKPIASAAPIPLNFTRRDAPVQFQIPKNVPRKISPVAAPVPKPIRSKGFVEDLSKDGSPLPQVVVHTPQPEVVPVSPIVVPEVTPTTNSTRGEAGNNNENTPREFGADHSSRTRLKKVINFSVNDTRKCLVASDEKRLLLSSIPSNLNDGQLPTRSTNNSVSSESAMKLSTCPDQPKNKNKPLVLPTALGNALKKTDFSHFLKTIHKSVQKPTVLEPKSKP